MKQHGTRSGRKVNPEREAQPAPSPALATFPFHGDELDVVTTSDGEHYVVLARLCEPLGLATNNQIEKLKKLPWARCMKIIHHDASGRKQELFCLSIRSVAGWLFTLNVGKVALRFREKLILYQRECADALADYCEGKRVRDLPKLLAEHTAPLHGTINEKNATIEQQSGLILAQGRDLELVRAENKALREQQTNGTITSEAAAWIRDQVTIIAPMMVTLKLCPRKQTIKAARRVLQNRIAKEAAGWGYEKGQDLVGMPTAAFPHVRAYLNARRELCEGELKRRANDARVAAVLARQGTLFGESPLNSNASRAVS